MCSGLFSGNRGLRSTSSPTLDGFLLSLTADTVTARSAMQHCTRPCRQCFITTPCTCDAAPRLRSPFSTQFLRILVTHQTQVAGAYSHGIARVHSWKKPPFVVESGGQPSKAWRPSLKAGNPFSRGHLKHRQWNLLCLPTKSC